ncbi:MAG: recombinase family protein [Fimbriimonadaceae bacterium]|nr:recombinase family protein [Alphaproteobacteria bacterium]
MSKSFRCAIYTRKSTTDGLEQDFNSLDAQREACEAYIASQASLGWKTVSTRYDDGGISGGTMDRPALQQLLHDIKKGHVDVVVVYKIDRLTRSLMDFARIVDIFDNQDVSFVSVTQQFNTTTSMGRLTLNVLLSFAQFEREVTAERIRDKIAASKKKGIWMGGPPPLGYDAIDRALVVNDDEAKRVRQLFRLYLECGSVRILQLRANEAGIKTKYRRLKNGRFRGGNTFSRGNLYQLLSNPLYIGRIPHHGETYPGQHEAIINQELWDEVQAQTASNTKARVSPTNVKSSCILTGLIYDETGDRLSPSHSMKNGVRYQYYISNRLMHGEGKSGDGWRVPARQIERPILSLLEDQLTDPLKLTDLVDSETYTPSAHQDLVQAAERLSRKLRRSRPIEQRRILSSFVHRIELHPENLAIEIDRFKLNAMLATREDGDLDSSSETDIRRIEVAHAIRKRGVESKIVIADKSNATPDPDHSLITTIAKAHLWLNDLTNETAGSIDELARQHKEDRNEISRFLPLAYLAPDIVEKILDGAQPIDLTVQRLRNTITLPFSWNEQRDLLGISQ